ncbi:hypothetical protein J3R83DRAFT_4381 [Lanmaoa asiatica]|nr:hypothetical protein J3R83DRAFT_4381 [Lanmaoa asiatica]
MASKTVFGAIAKLGSSAADRATGLHAKMNRPSLDLSSQRRGALQGSVPLSRIVLPATAVPVGGSERWKKDIEDEVRVYGCSV